MYTGRSQTVHPGKAYKIEGRQTLGDNGTYQANQKKGNVYSILREKRRLANKRGHDGERNVT